MPDENKTNECDIKKFSAVGPGLVSAQTGVKSNFTVYTGYYANSESCANISDPRSEIDFQIEGPSEPGPLNCKNNDSDGSIEASWTPVLPGVYSIYIIYKDENIPGSPFKVNVKGESIKAHALTSKVEVIGDALKSCKANEESKLIIDCKEKSIAAGLSAQMAGPKGAKANLELEEDENSPKFTLKFNPTMKGKYLLFVKIANQDIPKSPFNIKVV